MKYFFCNISNYAFNILSVIIYCASVSLTVHGVVRVEMKICTNIIDSIC